MSTPARIGMRVLVVDSDPDSVARVSEMLKSLTYEVITAERATEALAMTKESGHGIDLIIAEFHLPDMDGFQLIDEIEMTSRLPVVLMSADNDEQTMVTCLEKGAFFYIVKPIRKGDLKGLWQFVILREKENRNLRRRQEEEEGCDDPVESSGENEPDEDEDGTAVVSEDEDEDKEEEGEEDSALTSRTVKRRKIAWTPELHGNFLLAIDLLGLECANPSKILHHMKAEGITKEHVSSHLQNLRRSVRRERAVQSSLEFGTANTVTDYLGSSFAPYPLQSMYNPGQGIQSLNLQSAINHGQSSLPFNQQNYSYPNLSYATGLGGFNPLDVLFTAGGCSGSESYFPSFFTNSIMQHPQPWLPPPRQPPPATRDNRLFPK